MKNEIDIRGNHNNIDTVIQGQNVTVYTASFAQKLRETLEETYADLAKVFEDFSPEEKAAFEVYLQEIRKALAKNHEQFTWLAEKVVQMANLEEKNALKKVIKVIEFLLLVQWANCQFSLAEEESWQKVICEKNGRRKKIELFDPAGQKEFTLKILGPIIIRFLLERDFPLTGEDLVLICPAQWTCAMQCKKKEGLFPVIVDNFTNVFLEERNPSFFDNARQGKIHVTCGSCLVDIYKREKAKDIIERMLEL